MGFRETCLLVGILGGCKGGGATNKVPDFSVCNWGKNGKKGEKKFRLGGKILSSPQPVFRRRGGVGILVKTKLKTRECKPLGKKASRWKRKINLRVDGRKTNGL